MRIWKYKTVHLAIVVTLLVTSMNALLYALPSGEASPGNEDIQAYNQTIADLVDNVSASKIHSNIYDLQNFTTRYFETTNLNQSGEYIYNHYSNYSNLIVESQYFSYSGYILRNIIATLPGFHPNNDSVYIAGGHYDSVCITVCQGGINSFADPYTPAPGADDDATGTVVAMEAARVMSKYKYNATIVFAAWTAEEAGLVGSEYYATNAASEGMNIDGMLQFDMVGNDPMGTMQLDVITNDPSQSIADEMVAANTDYSIGLDMTKVVNPGATASDHAPFWAQGYPAIMAAESNFSPHWHDITDTIDNVNITLVEKTTKAAVATLAKLAGILTPNVGTVVTDKSEYSIPDTVNILLHDIDLNTDPGMAEVTSVTVTSNTEPVGESVTMTETDLNTSVFAGFIDLTQVPTVGELEVTHGDLITVAYNDLNPPGIRTATAIVDDVAPIISNVAIVPGPVNAIVTWDTDEVADSTVYYNTSVPLDNVKTDSDYVTQHSIEIRGLMPDTLYYLDVESSDPAGNTAVDDNNGLHYTFKTLSGVSATSKYGYIGYVRSDEPTGNHFASERIIVGHSDFTGRTYIGGAQFNTSTTPIPPAATITNATLIFYGREWIYQGVGQWILRLLHSNVDTDWTNHNYAIVSSATINATIPPTIMHTDLVGGEWSTFWFPSSLYTELRNRVNSGKISFRMEGPNTGSKIFDWSTGFSTSGDPLPHIAPRLVISFSLTGDTVGPETTNEVVNPNPTWGAGQVVLEADISDVSTGNSDIVSAEYYVDADPGVGKGIPMMAVDGGFDSVTEKAYTVIDVAAWPTGSYSIHVRGRDVGNNWGITQNITLQIEPPDNELPMIDNVIASPSPQEIFGNVNISANITDNYGVANVWVNITMPDASWDNQSMGNVLDSYYCDVAYGQLGNHDFVIWALDPAGNWNFSGGSFYIDDWTSPVITGIQALPAQLEVSGNVNISTTITDNSGVVSSASVVITDPDDVILGNFTMLNLGSTYYYDAFYSPPLGTYNFTIWAKDTLDNWNSGVGAFDIVDTTAPNADAGEDIITDEDAQVTFNASGSWDNHEIDNYTWNFTDNGQDIFMYGEFPAYTFDTPGIYLVTLNITDDTGLWAIDTVWVFVADITIPIADAGNDIYTDEDILVVFDGSGSSDNSGQIANYTWSFTDEGPEYLFGLTPSYTFQTPGSFTVILTVRDLSGHEDSDTLTVYVSDVTIPIIDAQASPNIQEVYGSVEISADVSDNVLVDEVLVNISYGLGNLIGNFSMTHDAITDAWIFSMTYDNIGDYDYTVWASDTSHNWDQFTGSFQVRDSTAPVIIHIPVTTGNEGETVEITATVEENYIIESVWIVYTDIGGTMHNATMTLTEGQYVYDIPAQSDGGKVTYTIWAEDQHGNIASTEKYEIVVEAEQMGLLPYLLILLIVFVVLIFLLTFYIWRRTRDSEEEETELEETPEERTDELEEAHED